MSGWLSILGTFLPLVAVLFSSLGLFSTKRAWLFSLGIHLTSGLCFFLLASSFYSQPISSAGGAILQAFSLNIVWGEKAFFKWDFLASILAFSFCIVTITSHFLSRNLLENSRAALASVSCYQLCFLGAVGSGSLFLFSIFLAGSLIPRFVLIGLDESTKKNILLRESALFSITALILLMVCVLIFANPFQNLAPEWFQIEGKDSVIRPGSLGFSLLFLSSQLITGLFPFHGSMRKVYLLDSLDRSVLLSLQPILGFILLFRFAATFFANELRLFGPNLQVIFSVFLLYSSITFLGSKMGRERIFWLQQILCNLIAIGFFQLGQKGWHGSLALLFFQGLVVPFFVMVLICHKREGGKLAFISIEKNRVLSLCTLIAVLSILGTPISVGFYGFLLILWSLVEVSSVALFFSVLAIPLIAAAGLKIMFFQLDDKSECAHTQVTARGDFEVFSIVPIALVLLFLGLVPKIVMSPMGESAAALLLGLGAK